MTSHSKTQVGRLFSTRWNPNLITLVAVEIHTAALIKKMNGCFGGAYSTQKDTNLFFTDLEAAAPADHVGVFRGLVRPAEHCALPGHGVEGAPDALWVLAAPAHDVDHACGLVPAKK